jgi:hypothetical protein
VTFVTIDLANLYLSLILISGKVRAEVVSIPNSCGRIAPGTHLGQNEGFTQNGRAESGVA